MKYLPISLFFLLLFAGCESEGNLTKNEVGALSVTSQSVLKYSGEFMPTSGIDAMGTANVYLDGDDYKLSLEEFSISAGPDLKIYLSTSSTPETFINLGALGN